MSDEELAEIRSRALQGYWAVTETDVHRLLDEIARLKQGEVRSLMDGVRLGVRATLDWGKTTEDVQYISHWLPPRRYGPW